MRKLTVALLAVVPLALTACGDESAERRDTGTVASDQVAERTVPVAGPAMLPALDSGLLAGLSLGRATAPDDIDPAMVEEIERYPNGEIVLYANPAAGDPFDGPWTLAVLYQGSEMSGLGGEYDAHGTDVRWIDVPVEQQSQELRSAGLLVGGMDAATADELAANIEVSGGYDWSGSEGPNRIEILSDALEGAAGGLERITSASVSGWEIGADDPGTQTAPSVTWTRRGSTEWTSLTVTSFEQDPGWELLLRAVNGGARVGPNLLPVGGESALGQSTGVVTVDGTTVLVQTQGAAPSIDAVLAELRPAPAQVWDQLATRFPVEPPPTMYPDADVVLSGPALGGAYTFAIQVDTFDTPFGPSTVCNVDLRVAHRDGQFDSGDLAGGQPCVETASIGLVGMASGDTLIHGDVAPGAATLRLTLDGGEVVEPELQGDVRRAFVVVLEGSRRLVQAEAFDADGRMFASFPDGQPELGFPDGGRGSIGTTLQGR